MTIDRKSIEIEATSNLLIYYEQNRMKNEALSDFIDRVIIEHYRGISRNKSNAKFNSALGIMIILFWGAAYILEFFKFTDNISLLGSFIIGGLGAILYYFKPFKGRVDDK